MLPAHRNAPGVFARLALFQPFDVAREKTIAGWLRILFFSSILFNHAVQIRYEFLDERIWLIWAQSLRDFGAVGFFVLAGVSLKGKIMLAGGSVKLPSNLLKLAIAAACLAALDILEDFVRGKEMAPLATSFYKALYDTNLWFFVAYAFASPMLLSLNRKGVFWTGACCLLFIMFPAYTPLISPYILQTISLAFVCMAIGMELHGRRMNAALAAAIAAVVYLWRVSLDDFGAPVYPALDIVLRVVYGVACFMMFKALSDRLCRRARPPGWATYLFVPYVIQLPIVKVATAIATIAFTQKLAVKAPPIFFSFWESTAFYLAIFGLSMLASFFVAWLLRRYEIRV